MSHRRTSSFDYHFDHRFVVFKNVQLRFPFRRTGVCGYVIHFTQLVNLLLSSDMLGLCIGITNCPSLLVASMVEFCLWLFVKTSFTMSQRSRASNPSILSPASRKIITSESVELCETDVCFLHIQLTGTKVRLPKIHMTPPEVDFESSRSPAKSESWNNQSLQCCALFPT